MGRRIIIYGDGKGKTTAAIGMMIRALGHHMSVVGFFFGKRREATGESWLNDIIEPNRLSMAYSESPLGASLSDEQERLAALFALARDNILSGSWDMVVLDEILPLLALGTVGQKEMIDLLENLPDKTHIILTGWAAPSKALALRADTISEVRNVKHFYTDAQSVGYNTGPHRGIEF